jgi:hypothetical protein
MTDGSISTEIAARLKRYRLIFVSSSVAFSCYAHDIERLCEMTIDVHAFLSSEAPLSTGPVLVTGLQSISNPISTGRHPLGLLRQRVDTLLESGTPVVMSSSYPKVRFPRVPGSSVLDDARAVHFPLASPTKGEPLSCFPSWDPKHDEQLWLAEMLEQLGLELLGRLDEILFESPIPPTKALDKLPANELDALRFAGLITPLGDSYQWTHLPMLKPLKLALSTALSINTDVTPHLLPIFSLLWKIERHIRSSYRRASISQWGNSWRDSCLTVPLQESALHRAREMSYRGARRIGDIRDPLEWLTLGELMSLRESRPEVFARLGLDGRIWTMFAQEVLPIRNQVSHMRVTRPRDLEKLEKWSHLILTRLA